MIEFALIAPILMTLLLGMFDLGPFLLARFKLASTTQAVTDLVTQYATMQTSDVVNFYHAGGDIMAPFSSSSLILRITNIASNGNGRAFIYWSCGQGTLPPYTPTTTVITLPNGVSVYLMLAFFPGYFGSYPINGTNTSFIMVESQYTFTPAAGLVINSAQTFTNVAFAMPRISTYVGPTNGTQGYVPPQPTSITGSTTTSFNGITCNFGS